MSRWHAVRYPIRPGSEDRVRALFVDSALPPGELTGSSTRLLGTLVFIGPGSALRLIEFDGELPALIAHLASRGEAQRFQRGLARYLDTERDLSQPHQIGAFFREATLEHVPIANR